MNVNFSSDENEHSRRCSEELDLDPAFARTLQDFSSCVRSWSEAEMTLPRTIVPAQRRLWRLAAGWATAAVLAVGAVSGGVYQAHSRLQAARIVAAQTAERQRLAAQKSQEEEDLLAMVDSDVSRQTPRAMEPLVQLMSDESSK